MSTSCPRQLGRERAEDVIQRLGYDHVVINRHQTVQYYVPDTYTCT